MEPRKVKLTKIAELPDAEYPNNIPVNDVVIGKEWYPPAEGTCYMVSHDTMRVRKTSLIRELISDTEFKTINSHYKIEYLT